MLSLSKHVLVHIQNTLRQAQRDYLIRENVLIKLKKAYSFSNRKQIWRLLVTNSDKLIIETRDLKSKEVTFTCNNVLSGKTIFKNFQLDEKIWLGIEEIYNDVIYFHKYAKPDMPGHKGIIAFDINSKKELWSTEKYLYLFVHENKIYAYKELFEGRRFFTLNCKTGELLKDLGENYEQINELRNEVKLNKDYSNYLFPENLFRQDNSNSEISSTIFNFINKDDVLGGVEYILASNLLVFNYHKKNNDGNYSNHFFAIDVDSQKEITKFVLNSFVNSPVPDSFFIYKNMLIVLKEKTELLVFQIKK